MGCSSLPAHGKSAMFSISANCSNDVHEVLMGLFDRSSVVLCVQSWLSFSKLDNGNARTDRVPDVLTQLTCLRNCAVCHQAMCSLLECKAMVIDDPKYVKT